MPFDDATYPDRDDDTPNQRLVRRVLRDPQFQRDVTKLIEQHAERLRQVQGDLPDEIGPMT